MLVGLAVAGLPWQPRLGWATAGFMTALVGWAAVVVAVGSPTSLSWGPRLALTLDATGLARVMAVLVPAVAAAVLAWVAATGGGHEPRPARLIGVLVAFVAAMELLVLADDLLTLLVAWELVAVCSWVLIGHRHDDAHRTRQAGTAYLTTRVGDLGLFVAAGAAVAGAGSLSYDALPTASAGWLGLVAAGVLLAAAAKSAQLPFSPWLFAAMAGPTPVSALLHSATMVAAGAYVLARLAPAFAPVAWFGPVVAGLGLATSLAAGLVALASLDLKRALAASTSAQYGLILVAVGSGATGAAAGHLVTHAVFKALLFLAAGTVAHATGTLDLRKIRVGGASPPLTAAIVVAAAALAAAPPLGGAWSKEEILAAAGRSGPWLTAGVVAAGALSALYAARLAVLVLRPATSPVPPPKTAEAAPLLALAAVSVALGALWLPGGGRLVEDLSGGRLAEGAAWELPVSVAALAIAFTAVTRLVRTDRLATGLVPARVQQVASAWFNLGSLGRLAVVSPTLSLSRALGRIDDAVIDAGVRSAVAVAGACSRLFAAVAELNMDRVVGAVAGGWLAVGGAARVADDNGVDRAVEGVVAGAVTLGARARRVQTGLSHQYYLLVAGGIVVMVVIAVLGRA